MKRAFKVLYVDDEEMNLFLFERSFENYFSVITASSGEEGLEKLEIHAKQIAVVISDMKMPKMSGIEFIRKAKAKYGEISYFILSAFRFNKEIEEALNDKIIENFFAKPFDVDVINAEVEKVVQRLT